MKDHHRTSHPDTAWAAAIESAMLPEHAFSATSGKSFPVLRVLSISATGNRFEIELRFLADCTYCCCEPQCFLPVFDSCWWTRLRENLRQHSDREPPPFHVTIHGVVEHGARLRSNVDCGIPLESAAFTYKHGPVLEQDAR